MNPQALRPGVHGGKDGSFRATFEDKPLLSDIIFLRAWVAVDLPRFYNPVTNLLAPPPAPKRAPKPSKVSPSIPSFPKKLTGSPVVLPGLQVFMRVRLFV